MKDQGCIKTEELESLVAGEVVDERRRLVESHLAECAMCRNEAASFFRANAVSKETFQAPETLKQKAREMIPSGEGGLGQEKQRPKIGQPVSWLRPLFGFASLILVLAVGFGTYTLMRIQPEESGDVFREAETTQNKIEIMSPAGKSFNEGDAIEFAWKPIAGANKYKFVVSNASGDIIEEIETKETRFQKPLKPAGIEKYLYWQVKTMLADGTEIESETRKIVFK